MHPSGAQPSCSVSRGLKLPVIYNTCGWERLEIIRILDGIVDIYLPDFKSADGQMAAKYSSEAHSYVEITQKALLEMNRQVGIAKPAKYGLIHRGLMITRKEYSETVGWARSAGLTNLDIQGYHFCSIGSAETLLLFMIIHTRRRVSGYETTVSI